MINERELREAIAECQGEKNPNANTCIKLASYYTILDNISPRPEERYSYSIEPTNKIMYDSGSQFSSLIIGRNTDDVIRIIDELMDAVHVLMPKLYKATIDKLKG